MSLLLAELTATCNALGYSIRDKNKYFLDKECKEAVRDLIRFLRRDDETHEIRRHLGYSKILQTDLLPILTHHHENAELLDLLLRLLVNLTTPVLLLYNEEPPTDKIARQHFLSLLNCLQQYKESFADKSIWSVLCDKLTELLTLDWLERGEEKGLVIVRILVLIRNILHVPPDADMEQRADNDANIHDQVLWSLYESGMINLILYIANSDNEHQYYLHVLEIISLMFRSQNAEVLATVSVERSLAEKEKENNELAELRKKEQQDRQRKLKQYIAARHSRFGGTYVVQGVKSVGDHDLVVHSINKSSSLSFDQRKARIKIPKNRKAMESGNSERRSAFSIRLFLKEFCIEFLNGCYNNMMHYVRELMVRGKAQANDESYYFWAMRFFMEFNRHNGFQVKFISETISIPIFHFIQERIDSWREKFVTDKKKIHLWSKRIHLALKAYKESLNTLMCMYQNSDCNVQESAKAILCNIFYIIDYREMILMLLNSYDESKFSKEYLKDLIESNHIFLKILEHFSKRNRSLVVQKKVRVTRRKKKKNTTATAAEPEASEECWEQMESDILEILKNKANLSAVSPLDLTSDVPIEEQDVDAVRRIRYHLMYSNPEEAIKLLLASREIWQGKDSFGSANMLPEEDCLILKEIYFSNIGTLAPVSVEVNPQNNEDESESDDHEDDEAMISFPEQYFDFPAFIKKFARPKVIHCCCLLLTQFEKNTHYTNHCVLKLLHRIAFDCKYDALLFQASVFRTFQRIFASIAEEHKELKKFATYIVRKFVELARRNNNVYVDLLFWKGTVEAFEMVEGYGSSKVASNNNASRKSVTLLWSEEQEDELRRLRAEYERDKPESDVVDWIHERLINRDRSRRALVKKLKELCLLPEKKASKRAPKEFSEAEIEQMRQLFEEYKDAADPIGCMMGLLEIKRPRKRIIDKIVELGLVQDRKQLRKKGPRKSQKNQQNSSDDDSSTENDNSDNEREATGFEDEVASVPVSTSKKSLNQQLLVVPNLFSGEVSAAISDVIKNGLKESLEWIIECLEETLADLSDSETDVPLLPLLENAIKAMDNEIFQKMLIYLGIKQPSDEQEIYWRIPGFWQANDIRNRITIIKNVMQEANSNKIIFDDNVENNFTVNESVESSLIQNDESEQDGQILDEEMGNLPTENPMHLKDNSLRSDEDENPDELNQNRIYKRKKNWSISSDEEDVHPGSSCKNTSLNVTDAVETDDDNNMNVTKKRRRIVALDSDSE